MANQKVKVLFVITKLEQGGSERFLFEVCQALDKEKFQIEILMRKRPNNIDYYYSKLEDMGIVIHNRMPLRKYFLRRFVPDLIHRFPNYKNMMDALHRILSSFELRRFFDPYDLVSFIQIDNYFPLQHLFQGNRRVVIHLMSNAFQYHYDYYAECDCNKKYRFVLMDPIQKDELENTDCSQAETMYFPLVMDFSGRNNIYRASEHKDPIKIGIVMRLSMQRPIEFFFYAFQALLKEVEATLHIYGQGDPSMFYRTLDTLHIRDKVFFEGQQRNLGKTLQEAQPAVVWLTSNGPILGYASIEVASFGIPMVFWNLHSNTAQGILSQTSGAIHSFSSVVEFVEFNKEILADPKKLQQLGQELREYVLSKYGIGYHIGELEDYYVKIIERNKRLKHNQVQKQYHVS